MTANMAVLLTKPSNIFMSEARHKMIIHHADGLHVRVNNRAPDKLEAALLEVFAQCVRFLRCRRQLLHAGDAVLNRPAIHKPPNVIVKVTELLLNFKKTLRVRNRRFDLQSISNDSWINKKLLDSLLRETCNLL